MFINGKTERLTRRLRCRSMQRQTNPISRWLHGMRIRGRCVHDQSSITHLIGRVSSANRTAGRQAASVGRCKKSTRSDSSANKG
jgi:hypothetical protein